MALLRVPLVCALFLFGCAVDDDSMPSRPETDAAPAVEGPRYYEEIRPILAANCVTCHSEAGLAPFALETYAQVVEVAQRVHEVTRDRIMPPFFADNSGECNTWANYTGLSDDEIAVIASWVENGQPMGDPETPEPAAIVEPELPTEGQRLRLQVPEPYGIDQTLADEYRCFVLDFDTMPERDVYMTAFEVHPDNRKRLHHLIVWNPRTEEDLAAARRLDEAAPGAGYPCYGDTGVTALPMALWAPGSDRRFLPQHNGEQTGVLIAQGRSQILQVHYNNGMVPDEVSTQDQSWIELVVQDEAVRAAFIPVVHNELELPPRQEMVEQTTTRTLQDPPVNLPAIPFPLPVYGITPHMHTLGRSMSVSVNTGANPNQCLLELPRWNFDWQSGYMFDSPIMITSSDEITVTCRFNTMSRDETTYWGNGTNDEMCIAFLYVAFPL